jgi:hypothetical protein
MSTNTHKHFQFDRMRLGAKRPDTYLASPPQLEFTLERAPLEFTLQRAAGTTLKA